MIASTNFNKSSFGRSQSFLLLTLAIFSGVCGLAYQVIYVRLFSSYFGDSFIITGVMLFSVFVGIAFGAWQSHRFIKHLAYIEMSIGFYSIVAATLFSFWGFEIVSWGGHTIFNVCKLIGLLLLPTFLIGTCVPLFAQYVRLTSKEVSHVFTRVYALYNFGAFLSIIVIEFLLFRHLGLQLTFYMVGAINILIGLSLLLSKVPIDINKIKKGTLNHRIAIILFLASFASGMFQIYVLRLSFLIFGPSPENFAIILTAAILGIAIGSALAALKFFSLKLALVGSSLGYLLFLLFLSTWISLWSMAAPDSLPDSGALILRFLFLGGYPLLLFTLFGTLVPLAVQAHKDRHLGVADPLLALSSIANGLGALLMFLVLYRYFTLLQVGFFIFIPLAFSSLILLRDTHKKISASSVHQIFVGVILTVGLSSLITHFWPRMELLFGYKTITRPKELEYKKKAFQGVVTYKAFDQSASIISFKNNNRNLIFNGHSSLFFRGKHVPPRESISGALPALFSKKVKESLVLGLGSGVTAGSSARIYNYTKVVEINPAIFNIPKHFSYQNQNIMRAKKC